MARTSSFVEANRQALAADHEDVVVACGFDHSHQLVAFAQIECDEPVAAAVVVLVERGLLDNAEPRGEEQVSLAGEVAGVDDGLDRLPRLQRQQVDDGHPLGCAFALGDVHGSQSIDTSTIAEEQQEGVSGGEDHVSDDVVGLQLGAADPTATTTLRLEAVGGDRLDVLRLGHHDDQLFVFDQVEVGHLALVEADLADPRCGELFFDRRHLGADDLVAHHRVGEDRFEFDDLGTNVDELSFDVDAAQPGELRQAHLEDVLGLQLAELEGRGDQPGLRSGRIVAGANERDDLIDHVECLEPAVEDVFAPAGLVEPVLRPSSDDIDLMPQVALQRRDEVERSRHAVDQGDHVDPEARLQLGELVQVVEHDVGVGVALQVDDEAGLAAGGAVVDVGDALEIAASTSS